VAEKVAYTGLWEVERPLGRKRLNREIAVTALVGSFAVPKLGVARFYALFATLGRVNLVPKVKARSTAYLDACIGNFGILMVYEASEIAIFRCLPVAF
jgi:hypothetical protein